MPTNSTSSNDVRRPRVLFFAGKGGVGKTTCAAARGAAEARHGGRVLLISTDPAHSLGDALALPLAARSRQIPIAGSRKGGLLAARELNGPRAFERWLGEHRQALGDALEHGTWLDREDINSLLDLSLPGVDELMALVEIGRIAGRLNPRAPTAPGGFSGSDSYDTIIVDTAPTGHTLRLLGAPDIVAAVAAVLDDLQEEHRQIRARFGRLGHPEAADRLIETIARQAHEAGELLRDGRRSVFHLVLLPEDLSVAETVDAMAALKRARIPVAELIVNRLTPPGPPCRNCDPRRHAEGRVLRVIRRIAGTRPVRLVMGRAQEPRGLPALRVIGDELTQRARRSSFVVRRSAFGRRSAFAALGRPANMNEGRRTRNDTRSCVDPPERISAFQDARLLFFGGKGGVGKTTCAAAAAIRLAAAHDQRRVLLLSTDPAHSLGDVLKVTIDDVPAPVKGAPPNLEVRELDAAQALAGRRKELDSAIEQIGIAGGIVRSESFGEVVDLAPPGIDELLGIISVLEPLGLEESAPAAYDLVVCDTAPTGHALRLLEMPTVAREWLQALLRMLLKYREVVRPGRLAQTLLQLSHAVRRLQNLLHDPHDARFVVVTRAADLPRLETERLIDRLAALSIAVPAIVVNAVTTTSGACSWCRRVALAEQHAIATLGRGRPRRSRPCAMILTPLVAPPPRGVAALRDWAGTWRIGSTSPASQSSPQLNQ